MHLAGCMLARIDGTSTIDYLTEQTQQDFVRHFCRELFLNPPETLDGVFDRIAKGLSNETMPG